MIGKTVFFSRSEIRGLIDNGELDDGITLAALVVAGVHV
jgi:hypothetical protein